MFPAIKDAVSIVRSYYAPDTYEISVEPFGEGRQRARIVVRHLGTYKNMAGVAPLVRRSRCLADMRKIDTSSALDATRAGRGELTFYVNVRHAVFTNWTHVRSYVRAFDPDRDKFGLTAGPHYDGPVIAGVLLSVVWATSPEAEEVATIENALRQVLENNGVQFKLECLFIPARPPLVNKPVRKMRLVLPLMADGVTLVPEHDGVAEPA